MGWFSKNRAWEWNKWDKSLLLYKPLSLFAIFIAGLIVISIAAGLVSQFLG